MNVASNIYRFPKECPYRGSLLNSTLNYGLLLKSDGVLVTPSYQRELVWTTQQKERFIESLILGLPIGEYTLHQSEDINSVTGDYVEKFELLDGQQRWSAIDGYINNEFTVYDLYWKHLSLVERRHIQNSTFPCRLIQGMSEEERFELYKLLAYGGTPHEMPK